MRRERLRGWAAPLAGLGVIGAAGGLLLAALAPELRGFAVPTLAVSALLLALAGAASLVGAADAIRGRRFRLSGVSLASAAAAVGAVAAVNALAGASGLSWDFTATRQFELAPQTRQALAALEEDVAVTGFAVESDEGELRYRAVAEGYLRRFAQEAGGRLRYEFVDPEARPSAALSLGVAESPALIFASPASESPVALGGAGVSIVSEQDLLTAILRVSRSRRHAVYFLAGHGERAANDLRADGAGFGFAAAGLRNDGHRVETLDLARSGGVPADASLLVIAAPAAPIPPEEERAIAEWLDGGGQAIVMTEPSAESRDATRGLLARWGVEALPGAVVDPDRSAPGDSRTLTARREQYASGSGVVGGGVIAAPLGPTLFPWAAAFRPSPEAAARIERGASLPMRFEPLVVTSPSARTDGGGGARGTLTLHLLLQASAPFDPDAEEAFDPAAPLVSIAVFGDADFASNRYYGEASNADLFLNAANYLLRDEALIAVRPKREVFRPLALTAPEFNLVRYVSWFLLPAAVAAGGLWAWRMRR